MPPRRPPKAPESDEDDDDGPLFHRDLVSYMFPNGPAGLYISRAESDAITAALDAWKRAQIALERRLSSAPSAHEVVAQLLHGFSCASKGCELAHGKALYRCLGVHVTQMDWRDVVDGLPPPPSARRAGQVLAALAGSGWAYLLVRNIEESGRSTRARQIAELSVEPLKHLMEANRDFARKFTRSLPDNQLAAMASLVARGIDPPDEHFPIGLQISERARDLGDLLVMLYVAGDEASRARMRAVLRADRTFMERVVRPLASSHQAEEHRGMLARWIVAGDPAAVQPLLDAWHEHRYGPAVCSRLGCETLTYKPASLAPRTEEEAPPRIPGCGRCKLVHYCSTECQAGDWKQHKVFCGKEPPPDRSVLSLPEGWKPVCTRTA